MKKTSWTAFFAVFFTLMFISNTVNHHETVFDKIMVLVDLLLASLNWTIIINRSIPNTQIADKKPDNKKTWRIVD